MNITDAGGKWQVTTGMIRNRKTGESRVVKGTDKAMYNMHEKTFVRKCAEAFATGTWS